MHQTFLPGTSENYHRTIYSSQNLKDSEHCSSLLVEWSTKQDDDPLAKCCVLNTPVNIFSVISGHFPVFLG